jgi:hypothetical protein
VLQEDDPNVNAGATAGIDLLTRQRDKAVRDERLECIGSYSPHQYTAMASALKR